jgi:hypothetical protein
MAGPYPSPFPKDSDEYDQFWRTYERNSDHHP